MEILIAALLFVLIIMIGVILQTSFEFRAHLKESIEGLTRSVEHQISRVVDGQRLSVILDLKGGNLLIKPEQFEPNRERLLTVLLQRIAEEKHPDPETWAYCVLSKSGLDLFLESDAKQRIQKAFGRLRANGDTNGARSLAHDIMKQL